MSVTEVHKALGLEALKNRTFQIFKASAIKGDGLDESMEWLSNAIQNRKWSWKNQYEKNDEIKEKNIICIPCFLNLLCVKSKYTPQVLIILHLGSWQFNLEFTVINSKIWTQSTDHITIFHVSRSPERELYFSAIKIYTHFAPKVNAHLLLE